jgi:hypothetical protein
MTGRLHKKVYLVRRSITPHPRPNVMMPAAAQASAGDPEAGLTPGAVQALQAALAHERKENERLRRELDRARKRLVQLRQTIQLWRARWLKQQADHPAMSARILALEGEVMKQLSTLRPPGAKSNSELYSEHMALKELVASLYRTVKGNAGLPDWLSAPPPATRGEIGEGQASEDLWRNFRSTAWHEFLVGKYCTEHIRTEDGRTIAEPGQMITSDLIAAAEQAGLLFELILNSRMRRVDLEM